MKKRSLVASIAMLLVSAIVLSTSTYAWFSSGASVSVSNITATIENTDGSIEISADNEHWKGAIAWSDLAAVSGNYLMKENSESVFPNNGATEVVNLTPISGSVNTTSHGMDFVPAALTQADGKYKVTSQTAGASGKYVFYKFYLRAATAGTKVSITPTFTTTSDNKFVFGAVAVSTENSGDPYIYSAGGNQKYYPMNASKTNVEDTNKDCILRPASVENGDTGVTVGDQIKAEVTGNGSAFLNVTLPDKNSSAVEVSCWIWVEGQHADCKDNVAGSNGTIAFSIGAGSAEVTTTAAPAAGD